MRRLIITLAIILFSIPLTATDVFEWSSESAYLMEKGQRQVGLFQPLRIGFRDNLEFTTHPVLFPVIPNVTGKIAHGQLFGFDFSSRHSLLYPTILLNLIAREGIGGIISPEFDLPSILQYKGEVLLSKISGDNLLLTFKAGLAVALKGDEIDSRTSIDLPVAYPRWATWYSGYGVILGGEVIYKVNPKIGLQADCDLLLHPKETGGMAVEHKGLLFLSRKEHRRFAIGYKLTYGEYPFGRQAHLLGPIFDFQWSWNKK